MHFRRVSILVLFILCLLFVNTYAFAQLPTFGPSCDEDVPAEPTETPAPTLTSPPNQPTYTPAPTNTPKPTVTRIPCSPTVIPTIAPTSGQGSNPSGIPTKAALPSKKPTQPISGTADTTITFLGFAGLLLISGVTGLVTFHPDRKK